MTLRALVQGSTAADPRVRPDGTAMVYTLLGPLR